MMKALFLLALSLWGALPAFGQTNDLAYTKRLLGDRWVNLAPLVEWWRLPDDARFETNRPLKNWKTLTGTKVGVSLSQSWIVLASVEGSAPIRVALWNPPVRQFDEFTKLQARWRELQAARLRLTQTQEAVNRAAAEARVVADRATARGIDEALANGRPTTPWNVDSPALAVSQRNLLRANADATEASLALGDVERELIRLKVTGEAAGCGADFDRDFQLLCLAADVNRKQAGLPVYDRGYIPK